MVAFVLVLVNLTTVDNLLSRVVLVERTYVPTFDVGHDIARCTPVPFALETWILDEVLDIVASFVSPVRLTTKVGHADSINSKTVAVDEHALIRSHGIAVNMEFTVIVIEITTVSGRIGDAQFRSRIELAHALAGYASLEAISVFSYKVRIEDSLLVRSLDLHLNSVALVCIKLEAVALGNFEGMVVNKKVVVERQSLFLQRCTVGTQNNLASDHTALQIQNTVALVFPTVESDCHICILRVLRNHGRRHTETSRRNKFDIVGQALAAYLESLRRTCAVDVQRPRRTASRAAQF